VDEIQAAKLERRIVRYEFSDYEWTSIKPMLPNKPRGARPVHAWFQNVSGYEPSSMRIF
jgi:hypothetical protein